MPAVSTMISSKPAALHAAMASPSAAESELSVSRVANERMKRSEEHTSELQSHRDLHSFPTRRSSDLDDDQLEARRLARGNGVAERSGERALRLARSKRAHEDPRLVDRVHADAVAQQRAAGFPARRVDRQHRDAHLVALIEAETAHQLVGQRRFSCAPRAGDAENGYLVRFSLQGLFTSLELGRKEALKGKARADRPASTPW